MTNALDARASNLRDPDDGRPRTPDPARAALRERIAEEIARQGGHPLARRTLALLVEAAVEPQDSPPGYRIRDRAGQLRRVADLGLSPSDGTTGEAPPDRPMTLADLVAEMRGLHPALFADPVPEAAPVEAQAAEPAPIETIATPSASSRFVETQTARMRTALARTAGQGRAVSKRVSGIWANQRRRRDAHRNETSGEPGPVSPTTNGPGAFVGRTAGVVRGSLADMGARLHGAVRDPGLLRDRRVLAAGAGLLGFLAVVALIPRAVRETRPTPVATAPTDASPTTPPARTETPAPADEPTKASTALSGPAEVIDTATLRVAGKLVRLFGVEWVRGGQADELTRYLAGRTVTCQPVAGSEARLCDVDGRDLSEVVLFNGGGRASAEATPDLVAAEDRARTERLGVWAR